MPVPVIRESLVMKILERKYFASHLDVKGSKPFSVYRAA